MPLGTRIRDGATDEHTITATTMHVRGRIFGYDGCLAIEYMWEDWQGCNTHESMTPAWIAPPRRPIPVQEAIGGRGPSRDSRKNFLRSGKAHYLRTEIVQGDAVLHSPRQEV